MTDNLQMGCAVVGLAAMAVLAYFGMKIVELIQSMAMQQPEAFSLLVGTIVAIAWLAAMEVWNRKKEVDDREFEHERDVETRFLPDLNGQYAIPAKAMDHPDLLMWILENNAQGHESRKTWANVPNSIHLSSKNDNYAGDMIGDFAEPQPFVVPSFAELYNNGRLPDSGFLLGFRDDGTEIVKSWKDLYSCIVNGASGTGKSTLLRLILAQAAYQNAQFLIADPHYGAGEESLGASLEALYRRMAVGVASNDSEILEMAEYAASVGANRLQGKDVDRTPLILVVDEVTSLMSRSTISSKLESVLGHITQETRKVGVYGICLGQNFNSDIMPTRVRNCFASVLSTPASRETLGRFITKRAAQDLEEMQFTQALWSKIGAEHEVFTFPNCTANDIAMVASRTTSGPTSQPTSANGAIITVPYKVEGETEVPAEGATEGANTTLSVREMRVREMLQRGMTNSDILKTEWGVSGGRAYQKAASELSEIIRKLIS